MENTFGKDIIPDNEEQRLENLKKYKILYSQSELIFGQFAASTATLFDVPIAMINFVDKDKVWTKANQLGDTGNSSERGTSLCSLAILKDHVTVFENALSEPFLISNPLVAGECGLRFYAAAPIATKDGFNIGSVCIVDKFPRKFSDENQVQLQNVANRVMEEIERRLV